jgi:hypothetical protein
VYDQKHVNSFYHADRLPSQFSLDLPVEVRDMAGIVENQGCGLKTDAVLSPVDSILSFVPTESQVDPLP